jgi:ATP-dependent exoDNAse (exonuclease V) beta subunit
MATPAQGRISSDEASRRRALDPGGSFLVQAPAGSGKTELLIQRFLALLAQVQEPEAVVAITFTRKAAGEMQDRILQALARAGRGETPAKPHERVSHELAQAALVQDRRLGWDLLAHPSRLRIQTIDSLSAAITRQMPWLARLGAQPAVAEQPDPLYLEAARRTLALLEQDGPWLGTLETVLAHLDNNVPQTGKLIVQMLRFRDHWLPLAAGGAGRRDDFERAMENAVNDGLALVSELFPTGLRRRMVELAAFAASQLQEGNPLLACAGVTDWPRPFAADRAVWDGFCNLLLTTENELRKRVDKRIGFPAATDANTAALRKLYRDQKERALGLFLALEPRRELLDALARVRTLPPASYTDAQWQVMESLLAMLKLAVANLRLVFREEGKVDFCEIAACARTALGDATAPTDLALGLDARLQHLLVDEFQDTSVSQFDLLEKLSAGWEAGDGRTIFLVGDPMQSIYRFRQAEVGLFLKVAEGTVGEVAPEFLRLEANHRSQAGIVAWINGAFERIFPATPDVATGAMTYGRCEPTKPADEGEAVTVHAFLRGEDSAEAALVLELVREARASNPAGTTAILVRARSHLAEIVPALKSARIPFRSIEIDRLSDRTTVRDLLALTRAMLHLADRPAWLAILRAPWCGLELRDLLALVDGRSDAAVWDLMAGDRPGLSPGGRERIERMRNILAQAFAERGRMRLRRCVERTWRALGGPACVTSDDGLQDAADYLDLLEEHEQADGLPDFDGFRTQVEQLYAKPDPRADGSLELMTIHKAKGLQFDTVIVPGLGRMPRPDSPALLLSAERPRQEGVDRLLASIRETGGDQDPVYQYLRELERVKAANENIRLLYVACTRARRRLHLIGHAVRDAKGVVRPQTGSLLDRLWPGLSEEERQRFTERFNAGATAEMADQIPTVTLKRLPLGWSVPIIPEPLPLRDAPALREHPTYLWVGDTLRHVGTVVHAALQRIGQDGAERWDAAKVGANREVYRIALANLGTPPQELDSAVVRVEQALSQTLASSRGQWILASRSGAQCEYPVAGILDGDIVHGAVDRTFVDEHGVCWIVDYKTSDHQGGGLDYFLDEEQRRYRGQLERYAKLVATTGSAVRLGLYFPLLDGWREWPAAGDEGGNG